MGLYTPMPLEASGEYLPLIFPNSIMLFLYVLTLSSILTWAFLHKHLNPFINTAFAILGCALEIIVTFFMLPISWFGKKIDTHLTKPIGKLKKRIHIRIPAFVKAVFCALLAAGVFLLDHMYNKYVFATDETLIMYPIKINGVIFWVSEMALWIGGFLVVMSLLYIVGEILMFLNRLLDHTMKLRITIYR